MTARAATGTFPYPHRTLADLAPPRVSTADPKAWHQAVKPWFDRTYGPDGQWTHRTRPSREQAQFALQRAREWRIAMKPYFDALYPEGDQ